MKQLFLIFTLFWAFILWAEVRLPDIFSDHAVLQRSSATAVFGNADAGEKITVVYGNVHAQTVAGKDGRFLVKLNLAKAGNDAGELIVSGKNRVVVRDVIVGEVWFCSGQSNMALRLKETLDGAAEIKKSANTRIRMFKPVMRTAREPQNTLQGQWLVASPATSGEFTAVGYYFAKKLHQNAGLAVGLINPAWGASTIESWISDEYLQKSSPAVRKSAAAELDAYIKHQAKRAADPHLPAAPPCDYKTPGQIFNAMVYPLGSFTIKGNLWYQGEGNAGKKGCLYGEHIRALVSCFRSTFNNPELRFYAVQLPNFGDKFTDPDFTGTWPIVRIRQTKALKALPFAGEVIILNLGESKDIHPIEKKPVGERLADLALKYDYGKDEVICDYPEAVKAIRSKNRIRVTFVNCHGGLKAEKLPSTYWVRRNRNHSAELLPNSPGSQVEGFTLCGADGKWHWADGEISGNEVIVSSAKVPEPVKVRYAFQNNPNCNLYNGAGLPAGTFELDVE